MKPIEFDTELQGKSFLSIPQEVAGRLPKAGHARVVVYVDADDSGDAQWRKASYERFMREDSPEDSVCDDSPVVLANLRLQVSFHVRRIQQAPPRTGAL